MALKNPPAKVNVDVWPHPLTAEGRRVQLAQPGMTAGDAVREAKLGSRPVRAWIDGVEVPAELLDARMLRDREIMTIRADVAGGDGNKILRTILTIGVLAASFAIPAAFGLTGLGASLASAGILVAGQLLVNALVPPELPRLDSPGAVRSTPVYSLSGGGNRARPYAPLLLVLGAHRVFPDLAAAEYATFEDGEQYLHQIFDFGIGDITVEQMTSGSSTLSGYDEVTEYWALGGGQITEIAGNVDTVAGAELNDTNWVQRTAQNAGSIAVDFVGRIFKINDKGATVAHEATVEVRYSAQGVAAVTREHVLVHDQQSQLRYTMDIDLPDVRDWTVEVRRSTAPIDKSAEDLSTEDERTYDDVAFTALRAFQPDTGDYAGRNRLGVRIKASAQLQGRLDRISGLVKQKVPVWENDAWTAPQASSNPAWIFRWFAQGVFQGGRLWAGYGLAADRIDDDVLKRWGAWCDDKELEFNYVVDREHDVWDILQLIARAGRASPSWQTGKLGVVYDQENQNPVAMITPGNIEQGSFGVEWVDSQLAEEVVVRYIEPDLDWQYNSIRRTVPGVQGTPSRSVTVTLNGVTKTRQAARMAALLAAGHRYHRRRVTWEMAAEGLSIRRGNVVYVTHSLVDGGVTGRLRAGSTVDDLQLNREVELGAGTNWLLLREHDGNLRTVEVAAPPGVAGATDRLIPGASLPQAPDANGEAHDVLWRLYDATASPLKFKVTKVEPLSDRHVRIVGIDEIEAYYDAADDNQDEGVNLRDTGVPKVLWISAARRLVRAGSGNVVEVEAVLTVAGDWQGAQIRVGRGVASSVQVVKELQGDDLSARWVEEPYGTITITAIPRYSGGLHLSGAKSVDLDMDGLLYAIAAPTDFAVVQLNDGTRRFGFAPPEDPDLLGVVIRYAADPGDNSDPAWGAMDPVHEGVLTGSPWETADIDAGDWVFAARALSTAGDLSAIVRTSQTLTEGRVGAARWLFGSGNPSNALGNNGDLYLDEDDFTVWKKVNGAWAEQASLEGADGAQWHTGTTVPANSLGADGDWYFREGTGAVAGSIYTKASGSWNLIIDIDQGTDGATWHAGSAAPGSSLGVVGDFYYRTSNGYTYEKTGATTWTYRYDLTGPQGSRGQQGIQGEQGPQGPPGPPGTTVDLSPYFDELRIVVTTPSCSGNHMALDYIRYTPSWTLDGGTAGGGRRGTLNFTGMAICYETHVQQR